MGSGRADYTAASSDNDRACQLHDALIRLCCAVGNMKKPLHGSFSRVVVMLVVEMKSIVDCKADISTKVF